MGKINRELQDPRRGSACLCLEGQESFAAEEIFEPGCEGTESIPSIRKSMGKGWWLGRVWHGSWSEQFEGLRDETGAWRPDHRTCIPSHELTFS